MAALTDAQILPYLVDWGFTTQGPWDMANGRAWYDRSHNGSYFATAIVFPLIVAGMSGLVVAVSTADSDRIQTAHDAATTGHHAGMINNVAAWLWYCCYFYPGLSLLNWAGITDPQYGTMRPVGLLGELIDEYCMRSGFGEWRTRFSAVRNGVYMQGLRDLFRHLSIAVWIELISGYSRREYAGLDMYCRIFAGAYVSEDESRFLLVDRDADVSQRAQRNPEDWYLFKHWISIGQNAPNFDYTVTGYVETAQAVASYGAARGVSDRQRFINTMQSGPYGKGKGLGKDSVVFALNLEPYGGKGSR